MGSWTRSNLALCERVGEGRREVGSRINFLRTLSLFLLVSRAHLVCNTILSQHLHSTLFLVSGSLPEAQAAEREEGAVLASERWELTSENAGADIR